MRVINTTFFKKYLSKENKQGKRFHFPHIRKLNFGVQFICIYFLINVARTIKYTQPGVLHKKRLFCQKQQFILKFGAFDLTSPDRFQVDFKKFGNRYLKRNMAQDFFSVSKKKKLNLVSNLTPVHLLTFFSSPRPFSVNVLQRKEVLGAKNQIFPKLNIGTGKFNTS